MECGVAEEVVVACNTVGVFAGGGCGVVAAQVR